MTRENLIQAIYDNTDDWSCQYTCPHTMEEENPQAVCMECADKLLAEYEKKIRADAIEEFKRFFDVLMEYDKVEWVCDEVCGEFINPETDEPWCIEHYKDMNFECIKKWLELKANLVR